MIRIDDYRRRIRTGIAFYRKLVRKYAIIIPPRRAAYMIRKAKRISVIVGSMLTELKLPRVDLVEFIQKLVEVKHCIVIASLISEKVLRNKIPCVIGCNLIEFAFKLCELGKFPEVRKSDLLITIGHREDVLKQVTSAIRHYLPELTILNIDRYYCENATYSFPTLELGVWDKALRVIYDELTKCAGR